MPDPDAGGEILSVLGDFPPFPPRRGSCYRQRSERRRLRKEAGLAHRGRARHLALLPQGSARRIERSATQHARSLPFVRGTGRGWEIAQDAKPGPKAIRADLLHEQGAHAIQELGYESRRASNGWPSWPRHCRWRRLRRRWSLFSRRARATLSKLRNCAPLACCGRKW